MATEPWSHSHILLQHGISCTCTGAHKSQRLPTTAPLSPTTAPLHIPVYMMTSGAQLCGSPIFFSKKAHFETGPPEYRPKHLFIHFFQNYAESYRQPECVTETVLMMFMTSQAKLEFLKVYLCCKSKNPRI